METPEGDGDEEVGIYGRTDCVCLTSGRSRKHCGGDLPKAGNHAVDSSNSNTANDTTDAPAVGTGLRGQYYDEPDFTNLKVDRTDATIDFNWGYSAPHASMADNFFSIRWTGQVKPEYSQTYTFYTRTDDGARLWVNNTLIIDKWQDQGTTEWSGTISLTAGQLYDIKMEYYDGINDAVARLSWSSSSQSKQVIPQSRLYPPAPLAAPTAPSSLSATASGTLLSVGLTWTDNASDETGFVIERSVYSNFSSIDKTINKSANATSHTDTDTLSANTTYYYRVKATNGAGSSSWSSTSSTTTTTAPTAPSSLSATTYSATRIDLTWTDNASNETGFKIDVSKFSNFSTILDTKTAAANATSLSVTNLDPNTTYYFRVRATNGAGDSSNSASATDTTDNVTATYLSDLNWTSATSPYLNAKKDKSANNTTLSIGSTTYAKGVGVHSTSELIYDLDGAYDTFEAYVGIDDNVGNGSGDGSAQWLVYVDNTLVYTSPRRTGADGPYFISVDITGCDTLKLVTNTGGNPGDNDYKDHANWADAKLLSTGGGMLAMRGTEDGKQQQSQQSEPQEQPSQQYGLLGSGGGTEAREHNAQNQITEVDERPLTYDNNGNLTTDEDGNILIYDAWNRLVKVEDDNEATIGEYEYDALMRRVEEDGKKLFHSANWQVIEERNAGGDTTEQYTWSPVYVDAMVAKDRDADANPNTGTEGLEERLYVQHDANFNVTSISDEDGDIVERYVYDPYGERTVLAENWEELPGNVSAVDFQHGHQGGKHNDATGLMHFRNREYSTSLMRWAQQDPLGYVDGANFYTYQVNSPTDLLDPLGTQTYSHEEAIDYLRQNKDKIKQAMLDGGETNCDVLVAALMSVYIEMRRDPSVQGTKNWGKSKGPGQIKPSHVDWVLYNDRHNFLRFDDREFSSQEEWKEAWKKENSRLIQEDPMRIAIASARIFIDKWDDAREYNPDVADLSHQPIILSSLYNLGPQRSVPKPNPGPSETLIGYDDGTSKTWGDRAKDFLQDPFLEEMRQWCNDGYPCPTTQPSP